MKNFDVAKVYSWASKKYRCDAFRKADCEGVVLVLVTIHNEKATSNRYYCKDCLSRFIDFQLASS